MKNLFLLFLWALLLLPFAGTAAKPGPVTLQHLQCESRTNPLGVDSQQPRLSWQLVSAARNQRQTAYQVRVAEEERALQKGKKLLWDSGKQLSDQSIQVSYGGPALKSAGQYYWQVRAWDAAGRPTAWSAPARWQMGLLAPADWAGARWLALDSLPAGQRIVPGIHFPDVKRVLGNRPVGENALPQFRKELTVRPGLKRATAFVSGLGHYEMHLNGQPVADHFLDPGWTNYDHHALYASYDITAQLRPGPNVVGVLLGNGFYNVPRERYHKLIISYGLPKLIGQLRLEYRDGTVEQVITDQTWRVTASPTTYSSIYGGEDWDATKELPGWQTPGYDARAWQTPLLVKGPPALVSQTAPPVKIMQTFEPVSVTQTQPGVWVYDLGQNMSAVPELTVTGRAGQQLKLTPAELLTADTRLAQQWASGGPHFYQYTLGGAGPETWHPRFTYYGFRYVQLEGAVPAGQPNPAGLPVVTALRGLHVRSSMPAAGSFTCSNELFNNIYHLIDWAIRSNVISVMTDCPHREKLGWLEETHLMGTSVRYGYDVAALLPKIIRDMQTAQLPNGMVPDIAPEYSQFGGGFRDSPEWGSAAVLLPWYAYQWYGDQATLATSYSSMQRYVDYLASRADNHLLSYGLGDWFDLGPKQPGESQLTPKGITATATYYQDLVVLEKTARLLGKTADAAQYQQRAAAVRAAFNAKYYDPIKHQYATGSQTANAMPLYVGLVPDDQRAAVLQSLRQELQTHDYRLTAGDIGFRYLLRVLDDAGASDIIFQMNNRADVPGYGYQLAHGATALTESWAALRNVSNNHFMLGHLMEWFYSGAGGIRPDEGSVAFRRIVIRPEPVGDLNSASTRYESPYGPIATRWTRQASTFTLTVDIPANTTATIQLPTTDAGSITESGRPLGKDMSILGTSAGRASLAVGSGQYVFECRLSN